MTPTMSGHTIDHVEPDVTLDIYTREGGMLRVENEYALERPLEATLKTVEGQQDEILRVLERLAGTRVTSMDTSGGSLVVEFEGGARLLVDADDRFEAWGYVGPDQERVISMPGGKLAIWD